MKPEPKKHVRCKKLASYISIWTYSIGRPPEPANRLYLRWLNTGKVPLMAEIDEAIRLSNKDKSPIKVLG